MIPRSDEQCEMLRKSGLFRIFLRNRCFTSLDILSLSFYMLRFLELTLYISENYMDSRIQQMMRINRNSRQLSELFRISLQSRCFTSSHYILPISFHVQKFLELFLDALHFRKLYEFIEDSTNDENKSKQSIAYFRSASVTMSRRDRERSRGNPSTLGIVISISPFDIRLIHLPRPFSRFTYLPGFLPRRRARLSRRAARKPSGSIVYHGGEGEGEGLREHSPACCREYGDATITPHTELPAREVYISDVRAPPSARHFSNRRRFISFRFTAVYQHKMIGQLYNATRYKRDKHLILRSLVTINNRNLDNICIAMFKFSLDFFFCVS